MDTQSSSTRRRLSRRRLLALTGGAAAAAVVARPALLVAEQPLGAGTPRAATPVATALPLPSTLAADASPAFRAVAEALTAAMQAYHVPGVALGILAGDREEHATFGLASLSSLQPVTPQTLFQIGSLSKTYTATAVWRLIDEGALKLDARVRAYLPDFRVMDKAASERVAVANLLDHTAGWYGDEGFETGDGDGALARYVAARMPQLPQLFPVGKFFSYNNAAFQLLGRLIEVATGTTYNAALRHLLLDPLGLDDTILAHDEVRSRPYADGHVFEPINGQNVLTVQIPLWVPRSVDPAGGIWATTRDVIRYARFHLDTGIAGGAASIVRPATLRRMQEPAVAVPGLPLSMGRDWFVQEVAGVRAIFHGGDTLGQHTDFVAIPEKGFAIVLLTNCQPGGSLAASAALDAALAHYPGLGAFAGKLGLLRALSVLDPEAAAIEEVVGTPAPRAALPPAKLAEYAGRYADPGLELVFTVRDGGLEVATTRLAQPGAWDAVIPPPPEGGPAPVSFIAADKAVVGNVILPFLRDDNGRVGWVASGLRLVPRVGAS